MNHHDVYGQGRIQAPCLYEFRCFDHMIIDLMRMIDSNSLGCFKLGCILWHTISQA